MVTALLVTLLGAAPLPEARLIRGAPSAGPCEMERLTSTSSAVKWAWRSNCGLDWVQANAASKVAVAVGNYDFNPVLLFDETRGVAVANKAQAPFSADLVEAVRARLGRKLPPGYYEMLTDPRDGSMLAMHDGKLVRVVRAGEPEVPVFPGTPEMYPQREGLAWPLDRTAKNPWVVFRRTAKRDVFVVRLVDPSGEVRELVNRPDRHGEVSRPTVTLLRLPDAQLPIVSALASDGSHLIFVPDPAKPGALRSSVFDQPPISAPASPPSSVSTQPTGLPPRCSESVLEYVGEARKSPALFEHQGRAFIAYGVTTTRSMFRFTLVARGGLTIDDDAFGCEWVEDARSSSHALVIANVTSDGALDKRFELQLLDAPAQLTVDQSPAHLAVMMKGVDLTVLSLEPALLR